MPPQFWFNDLEHDCRIRSRMTTDNLGKVVRFTLQLELLIGAEWMPIVRYDSAHGEAHIDYINPAGETYDKVWLNLRAPFNDAFTLAEDELKRTYNGEKKRFLRQRGSDVS